MTAAAVVVAAAIVAVGCGTKRRHDPPPPTAASVDGGGGIAPRPNERPPLPLAPPPADAATLTGIAPAPTAVVRVKQLVVGTGARPGRNDTVGLLLTGWRPNGQTFLSTSERKRAVQKSLATMAPGFVAALETMQVGGKAMLWIPLELSYPGPPPADGEATVYVVELVSVAPAPPIPPDVAAPPPTAAATATGLRTLVVRPGTGKVHPRPFDHVRYHYTAWDATGRMFDSSEMREVPADTVGFRQMRGVEETLTLMVAGERRRAWLPPALVDATPSMPSGTVCYELELLEVAPLTPPPPPPPLVAPASAKRTAQGIRYVVTRPGTGTVTPTAGDSVQLAFAAWLADGRLFDSSIPFGRTLNSPVAKIYPAWTELVMTMTVGAQLQAWVPAALTAGAGSDRPHGDMIFQLELVGLGAPPRANAPPVPIAPPVPTAPGSSAPPGAP